MTEGTRGTIVWQGFTLRPTGVPGTWAARPLVEGGYYPQVYFDGKRNDYVAEVYWGYAVGRAYHKDALKALDQALVHVEEMRP